MSTPTIPPRPTRTQAPMGPTAVRQGMPQIPPRPIRKVDVLSAREEFLRSPLNQLPGANGKAPTPTAQSITEEAPRRPPSIALPAEAGMEGFEYTSYDQLPAEAHGVPELGSSIVLPPEQTRNVTADVPLHAPKAALPQSTAKRQIETVTRTDSTQAAAAGIGRSKPDDDLHKTPHPSSVALNRLTSRTLDDDRSKQDPAGELHPLRMQPSFTRPTSGLHVHGTPRPSSTMSDHKADGIPEIGMQIPLYPNAGDVQAPSAGQLQSQFAPGIGFWNDGAARNHHRKRSSMQEFGPSESYGLHFSGEATTQFEKDWQMKHPNLASREAYNQYADRPETALSIEELNKLVHQAENSGMGTTGRYIGTPTQEIAHEATEEFTSRHGSPKPSPGNPTESRKRPSSEHQPVVESRLRRQSFPIADSNHSHADQAIESESDDVIHCEGNLRKGNKITGGGQVDNTIDLGPTGGNTDEHGGWISELGEGAPILASDEIIKRPGSAYMQPAVSPEVGSSFDDDVYDSEHAHHSSSRRSSLQPPSRPSSRPGNYQGGNLHRFISHEEHHASGMGTPLEEIEEYDPLFPEDEDSGEEPKRLFRKRPDSLLHHRFPSQDVWEDTPSSLQYQTTVATPEPAPEKIAAAGGNPALVFETPEQEQRRRDQNPDDMTSNAKTLAKPHFKPGMLEDLERPGVQRFPSRDIWEDTPDSMYLETTVNAPEMDATKSPPEERPTTAALPALQDDAEARPSTGMSQVMKPAIPARPERKSKLANEIRPEQKDVSRENDVPDLGVPKQAAGVVEKAKPVIPARPARSTRSDQADGGPLSKSTSAASAGSDGSSETVTSPPTSKARPAVPPRPQGSKIAALQAGFMSDLNKRLQLGPQAPPTKSIEPESAIDEEAEKTPLADARKSRAKGPARRKPAASPLGATAETAQSSFSISSPMTLWQIDESEELYVASSASSEPAQPLIAKLEQSLSENTAANTADPTLTSPMAAGVHDTSSQEQVTAPVHPKDAIASEAAEQTAASPSTGGVRDEAQHEKGAPSSHIKASEAVESELASPVTDRVHAEPAAEENALSAQPPGAIGHEGDEPEASIAPATAEKQKAFQPELQAALAHAEPAPTSAEEVRDKDFSGAQKVDQHDLGHTGSIDGIERGSTASEQSDLAAEGVNMGHSA